uniref:RRM domain-containing protein n=1 Tax=Arcella intermedia TaxID=1963864 RepID=A0A6B2LT52_9EUKA
MFVKNLPYDITGDELYDIFGKFGAIRQIRLGNRRDTRGTAFVIFEDIYDAKNAREHLSGFNVKDRYLIVLYFQKGLVQKRVDAEKKKQEIAKLKEQLGEN